MSERVKNDKGEVAILVSRGYGAGWSTWAPSTPSCLYDAEIVAAVLAGWPGDEIESLASRKWPAEYWGGAGGLAVQWLPEGTLFRIDEYDGSESVIVNDDMQWLAA